MKQIEDQKLKDIIENYEELTVRLYTFLDLKGINPENDPDLPKAKENLKYLRSL